MTDGGLEVRRLADDGVAFVGTLDLSTDSAAREALEPLVLRGASLTVDLSGLAFMDSTGLNVLAWALQGIGDEGTLTLRVGPGIVSRVLGVSGLADRPNVEVESG
ncbi:MAG TPA: STAS domain-containing protein [Actinomycetota bacterium]|nr:STAS domain-containing protein [Actinomycetota bacterium]